MIIIIAIFAEKYNHKPSNMTKRPAIVHSRDTYIARIQPFMRTNVVKVMVGHRRVGKSYILYQLIDRIKAEEKDANIIYTDVWASMGQEGEAKARREIFKPYQINSSLCQKAASEHIVLHCLPAHREEEITHEILEKNADIIFKQAENRMHAQKAILASII